MKINDVNQIEVPKYAEISVKKLWAQIKLCPDLMEFFPEYEEERLPKRSFILVVLSAKKNQEIRQLVKTDRENRALSKDPDQDQLIVMSKPVDEEIFSLLPMKINIHY